MPIFPPPDEVTPPAMLGVRGVAALLDVSARHIHRMVDSGRTPPPTRLGGLLRWPRQVILD